MQAVRLRVAGDKIQSADALDVRFRKHMRQVVLVPRKNGQVGGDDARKLGPEMIDVEEQIGIEVTNGIIIRQRAGFFVGRFFRQHHTFVPQSF